MHEIEPIFLGTLPLAAGLLFVWLSNRQQFATMDKKFDDLNAQVRHFIDLHLGHESRISTLEERTGGNRKAAS
jgi:hypothetical protein